MRHIETLAVHAGYTKKQEGAVTQPVYQSATFLYPEGDTDAKVRYIRYNNTPNHDALQAKLASLEHAEDALATASGMAAITAAFLTYLQPGDHALFQKTLYGGTFNFVTRHFASHGIEYSLIDMRDPDSWQAMLKPNTKVIYIETLSNPLLEVPDIPAIAKFARRNNLISMIDNTFASPVNFKPGLHGIDLSLHSATKYLNGHTDIVAGAVIGAAQHVGPVRDKLRFLGGSLDPHACYLLDRGIKTLALRVERQNSNSLALANWLHQHPKVSQVYYAGLPDHPGHALAAELYAGFGGVLSFELSDGADAATHMLDRMQLATQAPSLGGVETLITRPVRTSHAGLSESALREAGITPGLVRVAVGVEHIDDLLADFAQALA